VFQSPSDVSVVCLLRMRSEYFAVDAGSGLLYVARQIDRDEVCYSDSASVCRLTLDVALLRPVALFRAFQVHVDLLDRNDNDPTFSVDEFVLTIPESVSPGHINTFMSHVISYHHIISYHLLRRPSSVAQGHHNIQLLQNRHLKIRQKLEYL